MRKTPLLGVMFLLALAATPALAQSSTAALTQADSMALGRRLTHWFYTGQADSLWNSMGEGFRGEVGGVEGIREVMDRVASRAGVETDLLSEQVIAAGEGRIEYRRTAKFTVSEEPVVVRWVTDSAGRIVGAAIRPLSQIQN